jgi:hypothetical protein
MKRTMEQWLRGTLVALGAALAFASVGCIAQSVDSDGDSDVDAADDDVATSGQKLDPVNADAPASGGGVVLPGTAVAVGDEIRGPEPTPWRGDVEEDDDDPDPNPGPDPIAHTMSTAPSGGHHHD